MVRALAALARGSLTATPQSEAGITYARKIDKVEGRIDFSRPAREVHDHCRGLSPFPGAFFEIDVEGRRERIKVLRTEVAAAAGVPGTVLDRELTIACGEGGVRLLTVQRAGKRPMSAGELLRGFEIGQGRVIG